MVLWWRGAIRANIASKQSQKSTTSTRTWRLPSSKQLLRGRSDVKISPISYKVHRMTKSSSEIKLGSPQRPPLIRSAPVTSSLVTLGPRETPRSAAELGVFDNFSGVAPSSPQPQSYSPSRCAQSKTGLCSRSLTWLCMKHSL
jgi:hypothetical protein